MAQEVDYKVKFAQKYFNGGKNCSYDINQVDLIAKDSKGNEILYIESKDVISNKMALRQARAQTILTNKKQAKILHQVALIYKDEKQNDILELIDCDDSVMFNNDFNWKAETPSNPSKDAIDRINDRLENKIKAYQNDEIKDIYKALLNDDNQIHITLENAIIVYHAWLNNVQFESEIKNEQDLINLFLVDMLNGTKYEKEVEFMGSKTQTDLIHEGTNLNLYEYVEYRNGKLAIAYKSEIHTIKSIEKYNDFWLKYKRPPHKDEFLRILEYSSRFYTDGYRKTTGGEYTPSCFVELQNNILKEHYNLDEFIIFDPCAGVGNLQNQFGKDLKDSCYLSTLEQMDVDTCKIKGFENVVKFDYLKDSNEPKFMFAGEQMQIQEIATRQNKKLMVIMNPPYQNAKGKENNLAIEFFNKVVKLNPQVIVFYYMTESFLRDEIEHYIKSGYKIISHCFSNAKTFGLSQWSISQIIFDQDKGKKIDRNSFSAKRYEYNAKKDKLDFIKKYTYDLKRPSLLNEIDKEIKKNQSGMILGNISYLDSVINLTNKPSKNNYTLTTQNLKYALLSKGLIFNTHNKYFERNEYAYKGRIDKVAKELFNDAVAFSLFYLRMAFTNKPINREGKIIELRNFIMPFTHTELGCPKGELNVLYPSASDAKFANGVLENQDEKPFDFREFLAQFEFSKEAKDLFAAGLKIFKFYHSNPEYENKDYNDSFYDITNVIMGKEPSDFGDLSGKDSRISKVKTTKGTKGFGKNTIKSAVRSEHLDIFYHFFDVRDILAKKINRQLLESNLLLWERENIY